MREDYDFCFFFFFCFPKPPLSMTFYEFSVLVVRVILQQNFPFFFFF